MNSIVYCFFSIETIYFIALQVAYPTSLGFSHISSSELNQSLQNYPILQDDIIARPSSKTHFFIQGGEWPGGVIPYVIHKNSFGFGDILFLRYLMRRYNTLTGGCIRFKPRTNETYYLLIKSDKKFCGSTIGYEQDSNLLVLGPGCLSPVTITHEMYHVLGFVHEQSRIDRDRFVTIEFNNIKEGHKYNFMKLPEIPTYGIDYDYNSIVHYNQYSFSKNGKPTIITSDPSCQDNIGRVNTLSEKDILRIKKKYRCK